MNGCCDGGNGSKDAGNRRCDCDCDDGNAFSLFLPLFLGFFKLLGLIKLLGPEQSVPVGFSDFFSSKSCCGSLHDCSCPS